MDRHLGRPARGYQRRRLHDLRVRGGPHRRRGVLGPRGREGRFLAGGNRGISRVARAELEEVAAGRASTGGAVIYGRADGMRSDECSGVAQPASWRGRDGRLYFPTAQGVVVVDPAQHAAQPGAAAGAGRGGAWWTAAPAGDSRFRRAGTVSSSTTPRSACSLPARCSSATDSRASTRSGSRRGPLRAAYYTRLPPGAYTFRVTAANNDGVWNDLGDSRVLVVRPFFWETGCSACCSAWGSSGAGTLGYALRVRRLEARRRELEGLVGPAPTISSSEKERSEVARTEAERLRAEAEAPEGARTGSGSPEGRAHVHRRPRPEDPAPVHHRIRRAPGGAAAGAKAPASTRGIACVRPSACSASSTRCCRATPSRAAC